MLIPAVKVAPMEVHEMAANMMCGHILDRFNAIGFAPADEKRTNRVQHTN